MRARAIVRRGRPLAGHSKSAAGVVALLAATSLVLAACGGDDGGGSTDAADDGPAAGGPAADGPQGTIVAGSRFTLDTWENLDKPNTTYVSIIFEGLVRFAADGITVEPRLATEWEETAESVTFTLRDDVVFHDGTPFDAEAVKANFERIRDTPSQWSVMFDPVSDIVVDDTHQITLELSRPAPTLVNQLADRGGYMHSPVTIAEDTIATDPAGTGPFRYNAAESVRDTKVVVDYFEDYYEPESVGPERIEVLYIPEPDALVNALATGQVDVTELNPNQRDQVEAQGFETLWYPGLRYRWLFFDRRDAFADPRVRQAVCHAIDTQSFLDGQYAGLGETYDQRFDAGQPGYNGDVSAYPHDPERAQQLLDEAGVDDLAFTFPVFPGQDQMGELVRSQLGAVGIDVEVERMTVPQYFSTFDSGRYAAAINTSTQENSGPWDYYRFRFSPEGAGNPLGVEVPELDALAQAAIDESDEAQQEQLWQEMTQYIHDEALDCGFFSMTMVFGWDGDKVAGIEPTRFAPSAFRYWEAQVLDPDAR
ncbi:ABC transporter substrate-binding protein [Phytoactinopolyspora limicola]|uniref:ABC transporter substrate-binding protein n=1 Tax=Phytoactinopolyspora limicola TaxID=2715536 RepID=UPI00140ACF8B|nr:ABC transporter substrate-binding protein [Phytoactinopolyspora limicola]